MNHNNLTDILKIQQNLTKHLWMNDMGYSLTQIPNLLKSLPSGFTEITNPLGNTDFFKNVNQASSRIDSSLMHPLSTFSKAEPFKFLQDNNIDIFKIPIFDKLNANAVNSLQRVISNQENILKSFSTPDYTKILKDYNTTFSPFYSTIGNLGSFINKSGLSRKDNSILNQFEAVTQMAANTAKSIAKEPELVLENLRRIETLITQSFEKLQFDIKAISNSKSQNIGLWVTIISILLTLYSILQPFILSDSKNTEYKKEIIQMKTDLMNKLDSVFKQIGKTTVIRTKCRIRMKPKSRSLIIYTLPPFTQVNIIEINHKWIKITYKENPEALPITGWILKKYTN